MKYLLLFLLIFSNLTFANSKYCEQFFKAKRPSFGPFWKMDNQGKLITRDAAALKILTNARKNLLSRNFITHKDGTVSLEQLSSSNTREKIAVKFSFDSQKRITKVELTNDNQAINTVYLKYSKDGTCYPALHLDHLLSDKSPYYAAHTEMCRELVTYINKNFNEIYKCQCGTNKTNNALKEIFKRYDEGEFNEEKLTFNFSSSVVDELSLMTPGLDIKALPITRASNLTSECERYPGIIDAIRDKNLWIIPQEPSSNLNNSQGKAVKIDI